MWECECSLSDEIADARQSAGRVQSLGDIAGAIRSVKASLAQWSATKFRSVTKELRRLQRRIKEVSEQPGGNQQSVQ
jgi:hypothetical protein